jgi:membrane fusion protein (multidrug efflux system)
VSTLLLCSPALWAAASSAAPAQMPAPRVDVYTIRPQSALPVTLEYPARIKSIRSATVVSRVTGVLMKKHYEEGSFVKEGKVLYTIEPDTYAATLHEREADLAVAEALFTNAERDWKRVEALYNDDAISRKEYDAALAAYERNKAECSAARARLESARIDLGYTEVKAPISGIAGKKATDVGNVVSAGTPLVTITQTDPVHAEFAIPDVDLFKINQALGSGRWNKGGKDHLDVSVNVGGTIMKGTVDYIAPTVNEKTASIDARAEFANADNALLPGSFGRLEITGLKRGNVTMVPQKAVLQNPKGTIVFIVEDGKAAVRPVKLGDTEGENYIVEGALKPGDLVIVNNFFRVKPGMQVTIDKTINADEE